MLTNKLIIKHLIQVLLFRGIDFLDLYLEKKVIELAKDLEKENQDKTPNNEG